MQGTRKDQLARITAIYDDLAPEWDARIGWVERRLMGEGLRKALAAELSGDVLEIGSGTGATLPYVDLDGGKVTSFTATDLSGGMLRQIAVHHPRLRFARASGDRLPFRDATFDIVTCSLVLCTVPDVHQALREMARVCKPGGKIVLLEHVLSRNPVLGWLQRKMAPMQLRHMGCHLDRTTDRMLSGAGYTVESERRRFFGIFVLSVACSQPSGVAAAGA